MAALLLNLSQLCVDDRVHLVPFLKGAHLFGACVGRASHDLRERIKLESLIGEGPDSEFFNEEASLFEFPGRVLSGAGVPEGRVLASPISLGR